MITNSFRLESALTIVALIITVIAYAWTYKRLNRSRPGCGLTKEQQWVEAGSVFLIVGVPGACMGAGGAIFLWERICNPLLAFGIMQFGCIWLAIGVNFSYHVYVSCGQGKK
jgi:hypothetical protein